MGTLSKPFLSYLICLAVVLLVLGDASASDFNPYSVLGVSRNAGQAEIRKVYKQLVKEWCVIGAWRNRPVIPMPCEPVTLVTRTEQKC